MTLVVDEKLGERLRVVLDKCEAHFAKSAEREIQMQAELERRRLLTEKEAMAYLGRDANPLLYYRRHGLNYYKKGGDAWYAKGDIDDWLASGKVNRRAG
ncbi:hypothetical protein [Spirosoma areae]